MLHAYAPSPFSERSALAPTWRKLLSGPLESEALESLADIAKDLAWDPPTVFSGQPGLTRGDAGLALFFLEYYRFSGEEQWLQHSDRYLERAIQHIRTAEAKLSLFQGYVGLGWVMEQFNAALEMDEEDRAFNAVDLLCIEALSASTLPMDYDLAQGCVGMGLYALKRSYAEAKEGITSLVLKHLRSKGTLHGSHRIWWSDPRWFPEAKRALFPKGVFDLGLAHGAAGVASYLAQVAKAKGISADLQGQAEALLSQTIEGLRGILARDPSNDLKDITRSDAPLLHPTSLSWCYGELSLAAGLFPAGAAEPFREFESWVIPRAEQAAQESLRGKGEPDAKFCHGSAGNAHLFHRFYQATQRPVFCEAATAAFRRTLAFRRKGQGLGGYLFFTPNPSAPGDETLIPVSGLLEGSAGVGLALMSAVSPLRPTWDECLLLGFPPFPS